MPRKCGNRSVDDHLASSDKALSASLGFLSLTIDLLADRRFTAMTKPLLTAIRLATAKADFTSKGEHWISSLVRGRLAAPVCAASLLVADADEIRQRASGGTRQCAPLARLAAPVNAQCQHVWRHPIGYWRHPIHTASTGGTRAARRNVWRHAQRIAKR